MFEQGSLEKFFMLCVYCVKKMTSKSSCLVYLVTRPQEHIVVMADEN